MARFCAGDAAAHVSKLPLPQKVVNTRSRLSLGEDGTSHMQVENRGVGMNYGWSQRSHPQAGDENPLKEDPVPAPQGLTKAAE